MLISNMTRIFWNFSPKIPKSGSFSLKLKEFKFFTKLYSKTNSRTQIQKEDNSIFKLQHGNTEIRHFWSQLMHSYSLKIAIKQIRGGWFQIWVTEKSQNPDGSRWLLKGRGEWDGINRNWMSRAIISVDVIRVQRVLQTGVWFCYKCSRLVSGSAIIVSDR